MMKHCLAVISSTMIFGADSWRTDCPRCTYSAPGPVTVAEGACNATFVVTGQGGSCKPEGAGSTNCVPADPGCIFSVTQTCLGLAGCCPAVGAQDTGGNWLIWICNQQQTIAGAQCADQGQNTYSLTFHVSSSADCSGMPAAGPQVSFVCNKCQDL